MVAARVMIVEQGGRFVNNKKNRLGKIVVFLCVGIHSGRVLLRVIDNGKSEMTVGSS